MSVAFSLARAGRWLLDSGIQEPSGGVARFYRAEIRKNKPISTEITGYIASTLIYLFRITGEEEYLDRARKTAGFLLDHAWNEELRTFAFEHPSPSPESLHHSYFFDCGIVIRGLMAVWRQTKEERLLHVARTAAHATIADFEADGCYHPIVELPGKTPLPRTAQWSRNPGCYQLKSALSWSEVAAVTGDNVLRNAYLNMVDSALSTCESYLPGSENPHEVMDRLHPFAYFLEGLLPVLSRADCARAYAHGLGSISGHLKEIAPSFARSDVYAQLLRARIYASTTLGIDKVAAAEEAEALTRFQAQSEDPRVDGGFFFGLRESAMSPHVNPVSTAFALQAFEMWREFQAEGEPLCRNMLI